MSQQFPARGRDLSKAYELTNPLKISKNCVRLMSRQFSAEERDLYKAYELTDSYLNGTESIEELNVI